MLLKRERDLTDQARLLTEVWTLNYPLLGKAYRLKEAIYGIYDCQPPDEAHDAFGLVQVHPVRPAQALRTVDHSIPELDAGDSGVL